MKKTYTLYYDVEYSGDHVFRFKDSKTNWDCICERGLSTYFHMPAYFEINQQAWITLSSKQPTYGEWIKISLHNLFKGESDIAINDDFDHTIILTNVVNERLMTFAKDANVKDVYLKLQVEVL